MVGVSGLGVTEGELFLSLVWRADGDGHLCRECTFLQIREGPEFAWLPGKDRSRGLGCPQYHGWLPALSGVTVGFPWVGDAVEVAGSRVDSAHGAPEAPP